MRIRYKSIQRTFIKNFFSLLLNNGKIQVLSFLDIIGLTISLFPKFAIPPTIFLLCNLIVLLVTALLIFSKKDYRILSEPEAILLEHTYFINALEINHDENVLASCGGDHYAILWDIEGKKIISRFPHDFWVSNISFSPEDKYLFTLTGKNGLLNTWDIKAKKSVNNIENKCLARGLAVQESDCNLIVSCEDGTIRILNPIMQGCNPELIKVTGLELRTVCVSTMGTIATANIQGEIFLGVGDDDKQVRFETIYQDKNKEMIRSIVFNSNGSFLAFTDSGGNLNVLDISSKKSISIKAHNGHAIAVAVSSDDKFIVTGGQDAKICVWRLHKEYLEKYFEIHGHSDDITSLVFDHKERLYSASRDSSIKVWNLSGMN